MKTIVTLTLNPAIDIACEADEVRHTHKVRTFGERLEPGGGGINVARALTSLGAPACAIYLAGGHTGQVLDGLLDAHGIERTAIRIAGDTRVSLNVFERASGHEYRFVPEGPCVTEAEWRACLDAMRAVEAEYVVASGSLSECLPDDFYAQLGAGLSKRGVRYLLDTSGEELEASLRQGGVYLVKPSRGELEQLVGRRLTTLEAVADAASKIVAKGAAAHVAVTLGQDGAMLVNAEGASLIRALTVETRSAVGAGDSFLAGMTYGLASGAAIGEAFRMGMAAGAAAVEAAGTELCSRAAVDRLLPQVPEAQAVSLSG